MNTMEILIAGFGGQGVLFAGKFLAYAGLINGRQVSWLPSYGPEMRGGTANCSVIISDAPIGSPIVGSPDCLIAMNKPSFDKYQSAVKPGGYILYDSTLIDANVTRTDVKALAVPATKLAGERGLEGLSNMILAGKFLKECLPEEIGALEGALAKVTPQSKAHLAALNKEALALGQAYEG